MDLDWETGNIPKTFENLGKINYFQMGTMMETLKVDTHLGIHPDTSKESFSIPAHVMCFLLRGLHSLQSGSRVKIQHKNRYPSKRVYSGTAFSRCHSVGLAPRRRRAGRAGSPGAAHGKA